MRDKKPQRIAMLGISFPFRGGISHYSTLLVRSMRKTYDVKFITLKRQYPSFLFPGRTQYDYSSIRLAEQNDPIIDSLNPLTWIRAVILLKREKLDLIVVQWWNPFVGFVFGTIINLLSVVSNIRVCFLCHNVIPHESTIVDKAIARYGFFNAQYFIVHSEEDKRNLLSLKPNAVVKKSCHPTYSIFASLDVYEKDRAKRQLDIETNKRVILFFGLVRAYKGLKYLVHAMKSVVEQVDCMLLVVGEFYEPKDEYTCLIRKLGLEDDIVIVDKYISNEDIPLYFCSADVVVLPYVTATQSGIVQIAYALNKPVITTNVGGLPEVVEHGNSGFVVEPKSSETLSAAIVKYYEGGYEKEFSEYIKKRLSKPGWEAIVNNIELSLK